MTRFDWQGYAVEADEKATVSWYTHGQPWDCTCGHCRNFLTLARRRELPEEMLALLDKLGIPPEKAIYVCEYEDRNGKLLYDITYRVSGRVLTDFQHSSLSLDWGEIWCGRAEVPSTAGDFPKPYFDMTLWLWLPWVLDEPIGGEEKQ